MQANAKFIDVNIICQIYQNKLKQVDNMYK